MQKVDLVFRPEFKKYIPILKNTTDKKFPIRKWPNGTAAEDTLWDIKGFGAKFAFSAWITNFGQNIMYPYAKQKGMANIKISSSPHGSGFANAWKHYEVLPGTSTRFSETIMFVEGKASSLRHSIMLHVFSGQNFLI